MGVNEPVVKIRKVELARKITNLTELRKLLAFTEQGVYIVAKVTRPVSGCGFMIRFEL